MKIIAILIAGLFFFPPFVFADRLFNQDTDTVWQPGVQWEKKAEITLLQKLLPDIYEASVDVNLELLNREPGEGVIDRFEIRTLYKLN